MIALQLVLWRQWPTNSTHTPDLVVQCCLTRSIEGLSMAAEQLFTQPDIAIEQGLQAQEPTTAQMIDKFIATGPLTHGMYDGPLDGAADGIYISPRANTGDQAPTAFRFTEVTILPGAQLGAA